MGQGRKQHRAPLKSVPADGRDETGFMPQAGGGATQLQRTAVMRVLDQLLRHPDRYCRMEVELSGDRLRIRLASKDRTETV